MITIDDALRDLHRIVKIEGKSRSTKRLDLLADFCTQELDRRGIHGAVKELTIQGLGRRKNWDVAWEYDQKVRLAISLKSMLKNHGGTVPNRVDELMGEVANIQLQSPEMVNGYIMIMSRDGDNADGSWTEELRARLNRLTARDAPSWAPGTIEAFLLMEADFGPEPKILQGLDGCDQFFDLLSRRVRERNPGFGSVPDLFE